MIASPLLPLPTFSTPAKCEIIELFGHARLDGQDKTFKMTDADLVINCLFRLTNWAIRKLFIGSNWTFILCLLWAYLSEPKNNTTHVKIKRKYIFCDYFGQRLPTRC